MVKAIISITVAISVQPQGIAIDLTALLLTSDVVFTFSSHYIRVKSSVV